MFKSRNAARTSHTWRRTPCKYSSDARECLKPMRRALLHDVWIFVECPQNRYVYTVLHQWVSSSSPHPCDWKGTQISALLATIVSPECVTSSMRLHNFLLMGRNPPSTALQNLLCSPSLTDREKLEMPDIPTSHCYHWKYSFL